MPLSTDMPTAFVTVAEQRSVSRAAEVLGIALLPDYLCDAALTDGRLEAVLPAWAPQTVFGTVIHALVPPERWRLARTRALVAFLEQALAR